MTSERKNQLLQMAIVVALILVAVIPTIAISVSKANKVAKQQEETNKVITELIDKMNQIKPSTGLTAEDVQEMLNKLDKGLTAEQVQEMLNQLDKGLTAEEIQAIIDKALADLKAKEEQKITSEKAFAAAIEKGEAVVELSQDIAISGSVAVKANATQTIKLNGYKLTVVEGGKIEVAGKLTVEGGNILTETSFDNEGHDLGVVVKNGGSLVANNVVFKAIGSGPCVSNQKGGTAEIVNCEVYAKNSFLGGVYNNGTMTIKNSKVDVQLSKDSVFDAAILNYNTLTLENVTVKSNAVCVGTFGVKDNDVITTINGGEFTRTTPADASKCAIMITKWDSSKATKLVLKGNITVNVSEGVEKVLDVYADATVEGLENVK